MHLRIERIISEDIAIHRRRQSETHLTVSFLHGRCKPCEIQAAYSSELLRIVVLRVWNHLLQAFLDGFDDVLLHHVIHPMCGLDMVD